MFNYRDLGGHPVPGGRLRTGQLYRSSAVVGLDEEAAAALGLRTAVDLRESGEREAEPATLGGAVVHLVPVIDADPDVPLKLPAFCRWIVERRGEVFATAVGLLAHGELPAVFFCSAGKDRTGMLAGILLSALGVADDAVIANYAESERLIPASYFELAAVRSERAGLRGTITASDFGSPPELITAVLGRIRERHGNAAQYLVDHGLPAADLDLLRRRLTA